AAVPAGIVAGAGRGFSAYPSIATALGLPPQCVLAEAEPHAADVAALAAADLAAGAPWLDATLAQPAYLRDQVAHVPRKPWIPRGCKMFVTELSWNGGVTAAGQDHRAPDSDRRG